MNSGADQVFRALGEAALRRVEDYLVGFVLLTPDGEPEDASLGGSGTLIRIDELEGILTAHHVVASLQKHQTLGLVLPSTRPERHGPVFETQHCNFYSIPPEGEPIRGPDLAVLVPPPQILGWLRAKKSFYNLSLRRTQMMECPLPPTYGFWGLVGMSAEWTIDGPTALGSRRTKIFKGGLGSGRVRSENEGGGFDYFIFEALRNELYEGPQSFGGFSGGGVWQLIIRAQGSGFDIVDSLLRGVAYFQLDTTSELGPITEITCHGTRSLYSALIDRVRLQGG